ncbi:hypothetical protein H2201_002889 [Coniosporium apollinis]|uniref:Uncharacterized protein n=1 Tax=Coniosporium apollinis TaxID=61459 RepID=A0ABQ9P0J5_9PEZI|nr:hypothetical protein H2201_002889 [Coniosporium apollinis]
MSYYDNGPWAAPGRQPSWEQQPPPPTRSGASSTANRDESAAFLSQIEEVDRAADNLLKSGKMFPTDMPGRRESMPMAAGRGYSDARMGGPSRHHSVSDYDGMRSNSASNLQGYYASQRYQPRQSDADQMMQAKRRMAAQRERELRNYHQEQQYNRSVLTDVSGAKSDRSMSPNAMSEEERRELIARQHRALYGNESALYSNDGTTRTSSQDVRVATSMAGGRGQSPLAYDPFGTQGLGGSAEPAVQMPSRDQAKDASAGAQRSRANSTSSPASNQNTSASFSMFDNAQQSSRTSNSSPTGGDPPVQGGKGPTVAGVTPIGTRPAQAQGPPAAPGINKRSTTPLPSPLSFGFSANEQNKSNERSTSTSSNPSSSIADKGVSLGWGSNSGVWGTSKNTLGVQASVWG